MPVQMRPDADFDAVVVGAGHNGLVCAGYLARAGLRVCVIEARATVGGCAGSEDVVGASVNICNCDHSLIRTTPIIEDLELDVYGLHYLELDPGQVGLGWDAPGPVPLFRSVERTVEAVAVHYPGQVDNYRRFAADAVPLARMVLEVAAQPPDPLSVIKRASRNLRASSRLLAWSRRSVGAVLRHYFDHPGIMGPAMATGPAVWGLASTTPGTGLGALALAFKHVAPVGRPQGGSGQLTSALASSVAAVGGVIMTNTRVVDILCEGNGVRAVTVADTRRTGGEGGDGPRRTAGEPGSGDGADDSTTITAANVVVACNPAAAIVRYVKNPPVQAREFVRRWAGRPHVEGYESKVDARLGEPPRWRHSADRRLAETVGFTDHLSPSTLVAPSLDEIDTAHRLMAQGRLAGRPMLFINVPTVLDISLAPPGQHVFSLEVLFTPYRLHGGWAESREPERWLEMAAGLFEPGFLDSIIDWRVVTPIDYETDFNMPAGHADSFAGGPLASLLGGAEPELTRYETPIDGLYLTGAATFPGAGVWGAPGRNTALTILG